MENGEVKKDNRNTKKIIILVVFLVLIIGLVILIVNLLKDNVTTTTSDDKTVSSTSLYCKTDSKDLEDAFFDVKDASDASQKIKVIFSHKKIDTISYDSTLKFENYETAKKREAELHFQYGSHMQNNGKTMTDYSPNFSVDDTEVKISLFASLKQLNSETAKIFLINASDSSLETYSPKALAALYQSKGFTCEIKE